MSLFSVLFQKRVAVEEVVAIALRLIPDCIKLVHEECHGRPAPVDDASIANIAAAIFLFFIDEQLPINSANNRIIARAGDAMCDLVGTVGGNEEGTRRWILSFQDRLIYETKLHPNVRADRTAIINSTIRRRFSLAADADTPLDILPYSIRGGVKSWKEFRLV